MSILHYLGKPEQAELNKNAIFCWLNVSPGSVEADSGYGGKLDSHLIASCVGNMGVKNY